MEMVRVWSDSGAMGRTWHSGHTQGNVAVDIGATRTLGWREGKNSYEGNETELAVKVCL